MEKGGVLDTIQEDVFSTEMVLKQTLPQQLRIIGTSHRIQIVGRKSTWLVGSETTRGETAADAAALACGSFVKTLSRVRVIVRVLSNAS